MNATVAKARRQLAANEKTVLRVLAAIALAIAVAIPLFGSGFALGLGNRILIYAVWAMSLNLLLRNMHLLTLGHAGLLGAGAYGVAIAQRQWGMGFWEAALVGLVFGMVLSVVFGLMITRATDIFFVMITVAQGMIFWGIMQRWASLTGGDQGMRNVARPEQFSSATAYYWFTLVVVLVCLFLLYRFDKSVIGLRLRGVGDSDKRMSVLGYWVPSYRFLAFNVAGFFATISGILYVGYFNFIAPTTVHLRGSVEVALMAIIGGATSFSGPIVGAAFLLTLRAYLGGLTARWPIVLGILLIIVVLYARTGIVGAVRRLVYGSTQGAPAASASEAAEQEAEREEPVLD
jgi:branched-chain amino acid transport system permease protein